MAKVTKKTLLEILDDLKEEKDEKSHKTPHLYASGEFDNMNWTKFEEMTSNLKIATVAKSDRKGYILLIFLKFIIDETNLNHVIKYAQEDLDNENEEKGVPKKRLTKCDLINWLYQHEINTSYAHNASIEEGLEAKQYMVNESGKIIDDEFGIGKTETLHKDAVEMDLWTFDRIYKAIEKMM